MESGESEYIPGIQVMSPSGEVSQDYMTGSDTFGCASLQRSVDNTDRSRAYRTVDYPSPFPHSPEDAYSFGNLPALPEDVFGRALWSYRSPGTPSDDDGHSSHVSSAHSSPQIFTQDVWPNNYSPPMQPRPVEERFGIEGLNMEDFIVADPNSTLFGSSTVPAQSDRLDDLSQAGIPHLTPDFGTAPSGANNGPKNLSLDVNFMAMGDPSSNSSLDSGYENGMLLLPSPTIQRPRSARRSSFSEGSDSSFLRPDIVNAIRPRGHHRTVSAPTANAESVSSLRSSHLSMSPSDWDAEAVDTGSPGGSRTSPSVVRNVVASQAMQSASARRRSNPPKFFCKIPGCGAGLTTAFSLSRHMNSHTKAVSYNCRHCPSVFGNASDRQRHEKHQHTNKKRT
ncbi:hypothetical protein PLICRDRAFT_562135 [Plicaturopsis crispa FD-325 SS-3]|nr:hypothetical protein PLICRDRAFT_562135 [Plicaturopsis crispa FD-325 SS-3]